MVQREVRRIYSEGSEDYLTCMNTPSDAESTNLERYFREIAIHPLLDSTQEQKIAGRVRQGDELAKETMINSNLRLVIKIARGYEGLGLPLCDLIAEGNIGLMRAVERFDPEKGCRFSTYATYWVKQAIRKALGRQSRTIRLPDHVTQKLRSLRRVQASLAEELEREPTIEELADFTGLAIERLERLFCSSLRTQSLDAPADGLDDSDGAFSDIVADERAAHPEAELAAKTRTEFAHLLLNALPDREREVIEARFGLTGGVPQTLEEVGERFGRPRERVRQLQSSAICKMRKALSANVSGLEREFRDSDIGRALERACA